MKFTLELQHPELSRQRLLIDQQQITESFESTLWQHTVDITGDSAVELWFWPWKIKPLLRINGHLVDYGIAQVSQFDHMLSFNINKNFFNDYGKALVASRISAQFPTGDIDQKIFDAVVGHGVRHRDLINEIKRKISQ